MEPEGAGHKHERATEMSSNSKETKNKILHKIVEVLSENNLDEVLTIKMQVDGWDIIITSPMNKDEDWYVVEGSNGG